jgi:hypothetical protein
LEFNKEFIHNGSPSMDATQRTSTINFKPILKYCMYTELKLDEDFSVTHAAVIFLQGAAERTPRLGKLIKTKPSKITKKKKTKLLIMNSTHNAFSIIISLKWRPSLSIH